MSKYEPNISFNAKGQEFGYTFYFSDGTIISPSTSDLLYDNELSLFEVVGLGLDYSRRNYSGSLSAISVNGEHGSWGGASTSYLFVNSGYDFVTFYAQSINKVTDVKAYRINDPNLVIENQEYPETYDVTNYYAYNEPEFDEYNVTLGGASLGSYNLYSVFDYTNFKYPELASSTTSFRGENYAINNVFFELHFHSEINSIDYLFNFGLGSTIQSAYQTGFESGFSNGLSQGYTQGFDNGYSNGLVAGGVNVGTANAFDYVGQAFGAVSNIMSLEVLPHITLGIAFTIPMVFVLIITIFKLVRK